MAGPGLFGWTSMLRDFSSNVTDTLWSYLTWQNSEVKAKEYEALQQCLQELYGDLSGIVMKQAMSLLHQQYNGNMEKFKKEFFTPAVELLTKLREKRGQKQNVPRISVT
ncbi:uncharacterized protein LOC132717362 [Ruditapes philippinarum]|uniref:uncharacterized protein LOC132717362 n=1 Tax=Ruditapes philippinarum TaxID=129788 RepID=UPI00295ACFAA|nr:uncharacterized protein LOC132717362 [Ruditapes philippinarum]